MAWRHFEPQATPKPGVGPRSWHSGVPQKASTKKQQRQQPKLVPCDDMWCYVSLFLVSRISLYPRWSPFVESIEHHDSWDRHHEHINCWHQCLHCFCRIAGHWSFRCHLIWLYLIVCSRLNTSLHETHRQKFKTINHGNLHNMTESLVISHGDRD